MDHLRRYALAQDDEHDDVDASRRRDEPGARQALIEAMGEPGCPVCRLVDKSVRSRIDAFFYEQLNIIEGFEGDLDEKKHRGDKGGWRKAGLPWIQS